MDRAASRNSVWQELVLFEIFLSILYCTNLRRVLPLKVYL